MSRQMHVVNWSVCMHTLVHGNLFRTPPILNTRAFDLLSCTVSCLMPVTCARPQKIQARQICCAFTSPLCFQIVVQKVSDFSFIENEELQVVAQLGSQLQCTRVFNPRVTTTINSTLILPVEQVRRVKQVQDNRQNLQDNARAGRQGLLP